MQKKLKLNGSMKTYETFQNKHQKKKKNFIFNTEDWNAKVRSQEIPGVTGKFGHVVQNEAGKRLIEFCQENTLVIKTPSFNNTPDDPTHGHHQMVNTKIRFTTFF